MSKRQRDKHDINLTRTEQHQGSAKKMKISSSLRSHKQETLKDNINASSAYASPFSRSKLQLGQSPGSSTPRTGRQMLNTSHSESETEIIWDGNSPTAHLQRRIGRNGRSKVGDISEIVQCVNNQAESIDNCQADMPLLGLWMTRSPHHPAVDLGAARKIQVASEKQRSKTSNSKKATHKKTSGRLSILRADLEKITNAIDMAPTHDTPPRHTSSLEDIVDGQVTVSQGRQEPVCAEHQLLEPQRVNTTRPKPVNDQLVSCQQKDSGQLVTGQSNIGQANIGPSVVTRQTNKQSNKLQMVTCASHECQSITGQSNTDQSVITRRPNTGKAVSGQSTTGQLVSGQTYTNQLDNCQSYKGQSFRGQSSTGQSFSDQLIRGQSNTSQTVSGQSNTSQSVSGLSNTSRSVSGQSVSGLSNTSRSVSGPSKPIRSVSGQSNTSHSVSGPSKTIRSVSGQSNTSQSVSGQSNTCHSVSGQSNTSPSVNGESNTVPSVSGQTHTGPSVSGQSNTGRSVSGQSTTGQSVCGQLVSGLSNTNRSVSGQSNIGRSVSGQSNTGRSVSGLSNTIRSVSGQSNTSHSPVSGLSNTIRSVSGPSKTIRSVSGQSNTNHSVSGLSNTSRSVSGQSNTGPSVNGESNTGRSVCGQTHTGPSVNGQSNTERSVSGQSTTGQSVCGQLISGLSNTNQSVSGQSNTGWLVSGQSNTGRSVIGQLNTSRSVSGQSNTVRSVSSLSKNDRSVNGQSCPGWSISNQPAVNQSVTCQSVTSYSDPGQSSVNTNDIMWDDDSYFEDEALLEQLSQTEAMELTKHHSSDISINPKCISSVKPVLEKPVPIIQVTVSKAPSSKQEQPVQHVPNASIKRGSSTESVLKTNLPVDVVGKYGGSNTRTFEPKSQTSNSKPFVPGKIPSGALADVANSTTNIAQREHLTTVSKQIINTEKGNQECGSSAISQTANDPNWDSVDLFESSLTDEMMMALCAGMDSPQASKAPVVQATKSIPSTAAPSLDRLDATHNWQQNNSSNDTSGQASMVRDHKSFKATATPISAVNMQNQTRERQQNDNANSSTKSETQKIANSHTRSTSSFTFRRTAKGMLSGVNHPASKAPLTSTSSYAPVSHMVSSKVTHAQQLPSVSNTHPVGSSARSQPVQGPPTTCHQLKSSSTKASIPAPSRDVQTCSLSNRPATAGSCDSKPRTASQSGTHPITASSMHPKIAVTPASSGGSQKVCSQTEIERKRQLAMARRQNKS